MNEIVVADVQPVAAAAPVVAVAGVDWQPPQPQQPLVERGQDSGSC